MNAFIYFVVRHISTWIKSQFWLDKSLKMKKRPCLNVILIECVRHSSVMTNQWLLNYITFSMLKNKKHVRQACLFHIGILNNQSKSLTQISTVILHGTSVSNSSWETLMRDFKQFKCQLQRRHGFKVPVICPYWALVIRTWCQVAVIHSRWISRGAPLMGQLMYSVNCDCHARVCHICS